MAAVETNEDLDVWWKETNALETVISDLHLRGKDYGETLRAIQGFFQGQFTYSTWQDGADVSKTNETPIDRFLLRTRSGHCEYFATATVLLLRQLRIPARYAVGYFVHEPSGHGYVVRARDAHAWCIVWNQAKEVWENFDTTPASWVAEESKRASPWQWLSDIWSRLTFELAKLRWGQSHLREYVLLALVPLLIALLTQIIRKRRRTPAPETGLSNAVVWPGLDSELYEIEKKLAARGLPRRPDEPMARWLERAASVERIPGLDELLATLLRLHYRYRFDPQGLDDADRQDLRRKANAFLARLAELERRPEAVSR